MIRIGALGVFGLVGIGVVAALGRNPTPELPTIDYPVAATLGKSDRLPLKVDDDTVGAAVANEPAQADQAAVVTVDASAAPAGPIQIVVTPRPSELRTTPSKIISRHWHDPADTGYKTTKRKAAAGNSSPPVRPEMPKQAGEKKNCGQSGLDTFLRSINLKQGCVS
ncbi:hypothetical protein [Bradyrhizobium sp. USDA 3364]